MSMTSGVPPGRLILGGVAAACIVLGGCRDDGRIPTEASPPILASEASAEGKLTAMSELARHVAIALNNPGLRQKLLSDMRQAPFREHKLEFATYVNGTAGRGLQSAVAGRPGVGAKGLAARLKAVGPLEFYMPVREHREHWTGGSDLIVAVQAKDHGPIVAFDLTGKQVPVSASEPPTTPTLVLVSVETDFTRPVEVSMARNIDDQGGASIGTLEVTRGGDFKQPTPPKGSVSFDLPTCEEDPTRSYCDPPPPPPPPRSCSTRAAGHLFHSVGPAGRRRGLAVWRAGARGPCARHSTGLLPATSTEWGMDSGVHQLPHAGVDGLCWSTGGRVSLLRFRS